MFNLRFLYICLIMLIDGIVDDLLIFIDTLAKHAEVEDILIRRGGDDSYYGYYWEGSLVSAMPV